MGIPTLYRYIIGEIINLFLAIIIILLAIILSFRLSTLLANAVSGDITLSAVWQLIGLQAVNMLIILMPVAFILATIMTLSRLYSNQEMSAIFASGISRTHIHQLILWIALPIAGILLFLTLEMMPNIYRQTATLRDQAQQQAGFALLTANSFHRLDDGTTIYTGQQNDGQYADFFIAQQSKSATNNHNAVIFANQGSITNRNNEQFLILNNGIRVAWNTPHTFTDASYTTFERAEIHLPVSTGKASGRLRNIDTNTLNQSREHRAEWQKRLNPAIAMLIFSLCLPMLAHSGPRNDKQSRLLPAFILFALYINGLETIVKSIAKGGFPIIPGSFALHAGVLFLIILWWLKARKSL